MLVPVFGLFAPPLLYCLRELFPQQRQKAYIDFVIPLYFGVILLLLTAFALKSATDQHVSLLAGVQGWPFGENPYFITTGLPFIAWVIGSVATFTWVWLHVARSHQNSWAAAIGFSTIVCAFLYVPWLPSVVYAALQLWFPRNATLP